MDEHAVRRTIAPLGMVFWGGLLCVFDVSFSQTSNGQGFKCDILNDVVGSVLVAMGVFRLRAIPVNGRYGAVMGFVGVVSVLAVVDAIRDVFVTPMPAGVQIAVAVLGLLKVIAIVAFCVCMRWFCEQAGLAEATRSWRVTTVLFGVFYLVPLGLFHVSSAVAIASDTAFKINFGMAGLLLPPVFAIPLVHFFVSSRG